MATRREFLQYTGAAGAAAWLGANLGWPRMAQAVPLIRGLSDPAIQPKFVEFVPNALDPGFIYEPVAGKFNVAVRETVQQTGLRRNGTGKRLDTRLWGYGDERGATWPGRTIQVKSARAGGAAETVVCWRNELAAKKHLLPVDTSLHWAYGLHGYEDFSIRKDGVPIVTHVHGGHSDFQFDGNPEFFYSPGNRIIGPQWANVPGGFTNEFRYDNDVPAGNLWYHDHALGITRLNVYAGMAGFYFMRDEFDTGEPDNPLGLPAFPYELAYAIQDRMFTDDGDLFYPGFPGDPFWEDFITGEGLDDDDVPHPSALAEFFGDHMVVNGKIWPRTLVEPRHYRMRLLNGTDSRFMVVRFRAVPLGDTDLSRASMPLPFHVIGSDQGLASKATTTDTLVFEPGGRYDVVFDFGQDEGALFGSRIIMENIGGDAPFGGDFGDDLSEEDFFPDRQTDRIMAFDLVKPFDPAIPDRYDPKAIDASVRNTNPVARTRKVALFEGLDEYGRLQPLLGTAEPTTDVAGDTVSGAIAWHSPTTEAPRLGDTEIWEIYNATGDAHPVHLHLVSFEILRRRQFNADVIEQPVRQHNGTDGVGFRLENLDVREVVSPGDAYVENAPKDMVTALPEQVTEIKTTFDKPGRYVWHCHILSHEDHEMMRVLQVMP